MVRRLIFVYLLTASSDGNYWKACTNEQIKHKHKDQLKPEFNQSKLAKLKTIRLKVLIWWDCGACSAIVWMNKAKNNLFKWYSILVKNYFSVWDFMRSAYRT